MAAPIDPSRSASTLPPVARFLAEAALQRQSALLGVDKPLGATPPLPVGQPAPGAPAALPLPAAPVPPAADTSHISPQAREQLGAGFDPQRSAGSSGAGGSAARASGPAGASGGAAPALQSLLPSSTSASAGLLGSATQAGSAAWPATGPGAALVGLVGQAVAQLTAGTSPQRVVAAQAWPVGLAQSLESGALGDDMPPLQTWLVRQGTVQTPDGPRGVAVTLRVPVPWLASQSAPPAGTPSGALQLPFTGAPQALQSGVFALVLQGGELQGGRTSALLVVDFQPLPPAVVYGRDMLQARLDPWTQIAVLQASGQVSREEERARNGAPELCDTLGCPYAARAVCVQPFCHAMRGIAPPEPVGPVGLMPQA
ncbi:MAG: hypothetical protein QE488_13030 [Acidovorax sp.]|nr:hypothetical protein [Acidovorax sp.]